MSGKLRWGWLLIAVVVIAALVIAFLVYQNVLSKNLSEDLPQTNASIVFTETGAAEKFALSNFVLLAEPVVHSGNTVILESDIIPATGEQAVLARASGIPGVTLGVLHANGNFEPIVSDGTLKTDLQVTKDGIAVYAVTTNPVAWTENTAQGQSEEASAGDEEGHATGPLPSDVPYATARTGFLSGRSMLYAVDMMGSIHAARSLGEGRSPRRRVDDSIIAITAQGIAKLNAATGASSVILPYPFGDAVGSTISSDGVTAILRTDGNSILDAYRISGDDATPLGSIVSRDPIYGAAFADNSRIFLRTGMNSVALYRLGDAEEHLQPPLAHLPVVMSQ